MNAIKLLLAVGLVSFASTARAENVINLPEVYISEFDSYQVEFGFLHYAMAEAVGADADAAYEDAVEHVYHYNRELAEVRASKCPTATSWVRPIAGGFVAECGDEGRNYVATYGENGMKVESANQCRIVIDLDGRESLCCTGYTDAECGA